MALACVGAAMFALYALCPTYEFPAAEPFAGPVLLNPYADAPARWLKVNLHAHTRVWGGLTAGRGTPAEAVARYRAMGYDVAGVSNYESVAARGPAQLPVYEQGYGIRKTHMLVVGARHVDWLDYPLLEGRNEKQYRIDRLHAAGAVVIIAHPELRGGFSVGDFRRLTNYDAIEVASGFGVAERRWDTALSSGRLVWGVADDDSHNIDDPEQIGRHFTMIAATSTAPAAIMAAIRAGREYAVIAHSGRGRANIALRRLATYGDTIALWITGERAHIRFVGQFGRTLATFRNVRRARFVLPPGEPYARAVIRTPTTRLLLNPVVRTSAGAVARLSAVEVAPNARPWRLANRYVLSLLLR